MISYRTIRPAALILFAALIVLPGCNGGITDDTAGETITFSYNFSAGSEGWVEGYADYEVGWRMEAYYELIFQYGPLPSYLRGGRPSLYLSGNNHSGDLFMYLKRNIGGLRADTDYEVSFTVEIASDSPEGAADGPGSMVYLKAGVTLAEPAQIISGEYYRMNIDTGDLSTGGADTAVLGTIGVTGATSAAPFVLKTLESSVPFTVTTGSSGSVWLIVGTDSGYEGIAGVYYSSIKAEFTEKAGM